MSDKVEVVVVNNGPIRVTGEFLIKDQNGKEFDLSGRTIISLCRCGHSENKPFCDGSQIDADFNPSLRPGPCRRPYPSLRPSKAP